MSAILKRVEDPRTALDKARRMELFNFAQEHGISEITQDMPAIIMRKVLASKGIVNIRIPPRTLGQNSGPAIAAGPADEATTIDAAADLLRQWKAQAEAKPPPPPADEKRKTQEINFLRAECRRLGIKMERRDNLKTMRQKVDAKLKDLADEQNAPQRRQ